jgi:hypothetical protein
MRGPAESVPIGSPCNANAEEGDEEGRLTRADDEAGRWVTVRQRHFYVASQAGYDCV